MAEGFYHLGIKVEYRNPTIEEISVTTKLPESDILLSSGLLLDQHGADDIEIVWHRERLAI